jgi:hypothetical protein
LDRGLDVKVVLEVERKDGVAGPRLGGRSGYGGLPSEISSKLGPMSR